MEQENIPFNGGLEETDINKWRGTDDLKVIRGNGDFIVRERVFTNKDFDLPRNFYLVGDEQKRKLLIDKTSKIKKTIEDLISFGVNVAYRLVIGKNDNGTLTLFVLTDFIKDSGFDYNNVKFIEEVKKCFVGLVNYFVSKLESGEIFLADIAGLRQCVYGTKDGDPKPKLYMVDVDPGFMGNIAGDASDKTMLNIYLSGMVELIDKNIDKVDLKKPLKDLFSFYNDNHDKFEDISDDYRSWLESLREKV